MQRLGLGLVLSAAVFACTAENPQYDPNAVPDGADLAGVDQAAGPSDLAGQPDKGDMASVPATCSGDQRGCTMTASVRCANGMFVVDRTCPMDSTCVSGTCQPPQPTGSGAIGKSCASFGQPIETTCTGGGGMPPPSCEPFVTSSGSSGTTISWVCAPPIGDGVPGASCTTGTTCRTGFCANNGQCFRGCGSAFDCPSMGSFTCDAVQITVEGHEVTAKSCVKH